VAHSMGGLVARAALALPDTGHVERVVLLGTPHCGSYAAVQALRGSYAVVRKVARLATRATAEALASEVFSSFPSLYDLLPAGNEQLDLFDARAWPQSGPRPRPQLLAAALAARRQLAPPDERFVNVVGIDQETVTAVTRRDDEFLYTLTRHGDGTVPAMSAALPAMRSLYARVAHSNLTRDPKVGAAVVELLRSGSTARLPHGFASNSRACAQVSDRQLQRSHVAKVDWGSLSPTERRVFLQNLNEPPHYTLRVPAAVRRARRHP
jgi:pimeloyl-ACP methyl ester carboxylesterase